MNSLMKIALLCCATLTSALVHADALKTVEAFHLALTDGDKNRALELLDDQIVIYESGHKEKSKQEYASHHLNSDIAFSREVQRKVLGTQRMSSGALEVIMQETETSGQYKGKAVHLIGLETMVLKKQGDHWRIAHIHWSSRKAH